MKLITGENIYRDLTVLSDECVQHEYDLCYEILHGVYIEGELLIKGMLFQDENFNGNPELFKIALNIWLRRFEVAKMELLERMILSRS